ALSNLGAEAVSNKSTDSNLGNTNPSDDFYPSQKAVKNYVDMQSSNSGIADVSISNAKLAGSITATKLVGTDISTVGTITAGRWNGTAIDIANGGTGATNAADARSNLGLVIGTTVLAPNSSITAGAKTKITYDTKGLVTAGADATTADIAASTNKNYVTDVQAGVLSNTSGTNTGDETASTIKTKLGITTLSGNNTGDQTITLTGDVSGSGTGSFASTVNSVGGVSSATIATLPTSLASNTTNIISNTSDIATINTALVTKAPLASPAFTGTPTAPTPTTSDNSTKIATTEYVKASITASSAGLSSVGAISETSNAKGATISSGTSELILTPADATNGGILTNGTQSIAGYKTFESHINVKGEIRSAGTVAIRSGGSGPTWVGVGIGTGKGGTGLSNPGAAGNILTSNGTFWTTSAPAAVNAGTLTGSTLASNITSSSLTTLGTITSGTWNGTAIGSNVGGAGTVNGLMKANGTGVVSAAVAGTDYQAPLTTTQVGVLSNTSGTNTGDQTITLTGDVSGTGTGSFASTVNSVGGVSSAIIATLPTSIASNTTNIISNTSDIATINTALATKAPLASPSFTGTPTAPTPTTSDNSTQLATTAFVKANIGTASAETLSGTSLASNVANSSLTSVGTITSGTWSGTVIGSNYGGAGSVTGLMKANGSGVVSAAIAGTDYQSPITAASATGQYLTSAAGGTYTWTSASASTGVPYAGASGPVDLGAYDLKVNGLTIGRSIGSNNALNIAIGRNALQSVTTSNQSIGIGYNALQKLTTGYGNTSIGSGALPVITSGGDNVGIGMASLYNSLTPSYNVGVGNESLYGSNGNYNTGIGYKALKMSTIVANNIGTNNIGVGYQTLSTLTSGKYNTVIGNNGGTGLTTGNYNTILGVQTANLSEALSNNIIISDGQGNVRAQHNGTTGWTLGTITSGTWSGTAIAIDKGGTGLSSPGTSGNVLTSNGTGWTSSAPAAVDAGTLTGTSLASTIIGSNLTSLGTITSGTWNGTAIAIDKGGTGLSSPGTSGNVLTSNGTGWTSSAPAAVDAGTLTGTSLASTITGSNLTSLGTISSGTWSGTAIAVDKGGTGATTKTAAFDGLSPMTTSGDIIYGGTSGTGTRLGKGTDGQVLTLASGLPTWSTAAASSGGGLSSIGAISGTSTPKGATINGTTELILTPADTTNGGVVTTGAQIFAGVKTFSPTVTATANNQILSGLDINPTFNNSTFTGVNNYGLRVQGVGIGTGGGNMPDNTAIGKSALYANSTGVKNTGIGVDALKLNRTGFNNTAIGYQAASGQGSPSYVTAIGSGALSVSTGSDNTAIGAFALHRNTSGINNTVVGTSALSFNRTGNNNVVMGHQALVASSLNSSDDNTAIGFKSMYNNMTGGTNTIIGSLSGFNNTTGAGNANYGYKSLYNNQAGSDNVALGNNSGSLAGSSTGVSLTSSNQSIFIGSGTRAGTNTSTNEVVIGYGAVGNGSNTTTIGNSSTTQTYLPSGLTMGNSLGSVDATLTLHPNSTSAQGGSEGGQLNFKKSVSTSAYDWFIDQYADGNGARLRILPGRTSPESYGLAISEDGNMGIGSIPNASYKLHVAGDINATGSVRASGVALSSDFRLKTNISSLNSAMKTLNLLSPVSYDKKVSLADSVYSKQELGFIAQEVQKVLPQLVTEGKDKDRLLSLDYISIIPLLTKAMQEQDVVIKDAQKENTTLKKQLEEQKKRLDAIEQLVQKLSTNLK
uniref:tail fiber domain-containing protein n=1 Tax=Daejeonella sp. TaxID=2805397 RepID=UPI003784593F